MAAIGMLGARTPHALPSAVHDMPLPPRAAVGGAASPAVHAALGRYNVKGEDAHLLSESVELEPGRVVHVYGVFDGHGGPRAANFAAAHAVKRLVDGYQAASKGWGASSHEARLESACRSAFVGLDQAFIASSPGAHDGTTATVAIVDAERITVASVGDSTARLLVRSADGSVSAFQASADHRVDRRDAAEEARVLAAGAQIGRVKGRDGKPVGPERLYPGALAVSRSIGDADAGQAAIATPEVHTHSFPAHGGVLLLATDGVWDFAKEATVDQLCGVALSRSLSPKWLAHSLMEKARPANAGEDDATLIAVLLGVPSAAQDGSAGSAKSARESVGARIKSLFGRTRSHETRSVPDSPRAADASGRHVRQSDPPTSPSTGGSSHGRRRALRLSLGGGQR